MVALALVLLLAACASHSRGAESRAAIPLDPGALTGTSWVLVGTGEFEGVSDSAPLTLDVGDGFASGTASCNRYRVPFSHDGNDLSTGPLVSTNKACAPRLMQAEQRFFRSIESADTIEKEDDRLVVSGPDDDDRLVFARAEPARKLAGEWDIVSFATEDAVTSVLAGTSPSLDFDSDGTVAVDAGCNTGSSSWTARGRSISIDRPRTTSKSCSTPDGIMEQEASIIDALERATTVDWAGTQASLTNQRDMIVLVLARTT